jgi:acetyl esterase/lipase
MKYVLFLFFTTINSIALTQETIRLYSGIVPSSNGSTKNIETSEPIKVGQKDAIFIKGVTVPELTIYLPDNPNGIGVVICPGGAYVGLAMDHEGHDIAKKLNEKGIAAFVLKYRMPLTDFFNNKEYVPLQDAQRAIQLVRKNSKKWKLKTNKIGILGSSAGGHLAASTATMFHKNYIANDQNTDLRPSFLILNYPVITFQDNYTHKYSRLMLIGSPDQNETDKMDDVKMTAFSCELNVDKNTPPTFITHAMDDDAVPIQNSLLFIAAMEQNNRRVETFFYEKGGHGYGMDNAKANVDWIEKAMQFMTNVYKK